MKKQEIEIFDPCLISSIVARANQHIDSKLFLGINHLGIDNSGDLIYPAAGPSPAKLSPPLRISWQGSNLNQSLESIQQIQLRSSREFSPPGSHQWPLKFLKNELKIAIVDLKIIN